MRDPPNAESKHSPCAKPFLRVSATTHEAPSALSLLKRDFCAQKHATCPRALEGSHLQVPPTISSEF